MFRECLVRNVVLLNEDRMMNGQSEGGRGGGCGGGCGCLARWRRGWRPRSGGVSRSRAGSPVWSHGGSGGGVAGLRMLAVPVGAVACAGGWRAAAAADLAAGVAVDVVARRRRRRRRRSGLRASVLVFGISFPVAGSLFGAGAGGWGDAARRRTGRRSDGIVIVTWRLWRCTCNAVGFAAGLVALLRRGRRRRIVVPLVMRLGPVRTGSCVADSFLASPPD